MEGRKGVETYTRPNVKEETKVDVDDVSFAVDHDVPVVSVLDLEDVASDGVGGHGLDEVEASTLEGNCVLPAIFGDEEVEQVVDFSATHFVSRRCVRNDVNDTAAWTRRGYTVGVEV